MVDGSRRSLDTFFKMFEPLIWNNENILKEKNWKIHRLSFFSHLKI